MTPRSHAGSLPPSPSRRRMIASTALLMSCRAAKGQSAGAAFADLAGVGRVPCVATSDFGHVDELVSALPQTGRDNDSSFNCFFYMRTYVEDRLPPEYPMRWSTDPRRNWSAPSRAYADAGYLLMHGYRLAMAPRKLAGHDGFEPGDVIMVPGTDALGPVVGIDQQYYHVGVVRATRGGQISRIRQKLNPRQCVVDLTAAQFQKVYGLEGDDTYEVWRRG